MPTNLAIYTNVSAVDSDRITTPANYVLVDTATDKLIFTAGSTAVADGQDTPTNTELDQAATIIQSTDTEISQAFLQDFSSTGIELKQIALFGSGNNQFVFNLSFDNATATEPVLQAWDDNTHITADLNVLGGGTPSNSMIKAVLTTSAPPGVSWVGTQLAGGVLPNVLELNGGAGAFTSASEVYVNLKIVVPGNFITPFSEQPVISVRFTFV